MKKKKKDVAQQTTNAFLQRSKPTLINHFSSYYTKIGVVDGAAGHARTLESQRNQIRTSLLPRRKG